MCDLLLLNWEVMLSSCCHGIYLVRVKIEFELDFGYRYIVVCQKRKSVVFSWFYLFSYLP